ncbi:DUF7524 family protein [Halomicrobium salinisoli]|uniref:DUF7524 family protein n=1 Tax=Halomicrobium salinisoli TaxID=2878391 RepID=UPI001CEFC87F|nr:hypothetical protein [Halomicrobium salinisoli]
MPDTLPVHVNRQSLHSLEVPASFETDDSFDVRLINHGEPVHVHLHLDDALSEIATIEATNHYVDADSQRPVGVSLREDGSVFGKLKIATGYGAETRYVDVRITEPADEQEEVRVDESLAQPQPDAGTDEDAAGSLLDGERSVFLLGGLSLFVAAMAAAFVQSTAVRIGAGVVALTVLAGLYAAAGARGDGG